MKIISFENAETISKAFWDPRSNRMEETNNRALMLLDQLMDSPTVDIKAFKRVADVCDEETPDEP